MKISENVTGLHHIDIPTSQVVDSMLFYAEIGFEVVDYGSDPETGLPVNVMQAGDLIIMLSGREAADVEDQRIHFSINVRDAEKALDDVCSRGLNNIDDELHTASWNGGTIRYFTVEGPNKELIQFCQNI